MGKIRILPDTLVSKISAGEVVERPASVVKELIENSIDASADKIFIHLKFGGKRHIKIVDNGLGMTRDDALMSLERHATSKIKDVNDLFSLNTLGFRGEALPSIASVSRLYIITKTADSESGTEIISEGGIVRKVKDIACNTGTIIDVDQLFFNTPPRRKFLKSSKTELMRVCEIVQREALSKPEIAFKLFSEEKIIYDYKSADNIKDRISSVISNTELYAFEYENREIKVRGYLSSPSETRSSMQKLYTYVNGRPVRDRFINRMIMDSYGNLIEKRKFPQGVVFITIDPGEVDVNVHPTKFEVKFRNQFQTGEYIKEAVGDMINQAPWIKGYKRRAEHALKNFYENQKEYSRTDVSAEHSRLVNNNNNLKGSDLNQTQLKPEEIPAAIVDSENDSKLISKGYYSDLNIIGQIGKLYIVCESPEGMIVVDQHAAHERVNFEKVKKSYLEDNKIHAQQLLMPEVLELNHQEMETANSNKQEIVKLGFEFENFGKNTIRLKSVPGFLLNHSYTEIFLTVVNEIYELGEIRTLRDKLDLVCATIACHSSIRANQNLSRQETIVLFKDLDNCDYPHSCPHGRPIATEISYLMLEKLFRRI